MTQYNLWLGLLGILGLLVIICLILTLQDIKVNKWPIGKKHKLKWKGYTIYTIVHPECKLWELQEFQRAGLKALQTSIFAYVKEIKTYYADAVKTVTLYVVPDYMAIQSTQSYSTHLYSIPTIIIPIGNIDALIETGKPVIKEVLKILFNSTKVKSSVRKTAEQSFSVMK